MSKRNIIIIAIAVIVLVGGTILFLSQKGKPVSESASPVAGREADSETESLKSDQTTTVDPLIILRSQLTLRARSFVERYGTYSSDSGYSNLKELLPQMSEKLAEEVLTRINQGLEQEQGFFALATKVLSLNIKEIDPESKAVFFMQVQEQQMKPGQTDILYKSIELTSIKDGNEWKVDKINYKP